MRPLFSQTAVFKVRGSMFMAFKKRFSDKSVLLTPGYFPCIHFSRAIVYFLFIYRLHEKKYIQNNSYIDNKYKFTYIMNLNDFEKRMNDSLR